MMDIDPQVEQRLQTEQNIWLATARPNGNPHLVPIWFVWQDEKIYLCTGSQSVKARNMAANPNVELSLENANTPIVIEGQARSIEQVDRSVIEAFRRKFDWDITSDSQYNDVIEITPRRIRV
jgi:F420H(2)-dependent biliverdin reductase